MSYKDSMPNSMMDHQLGSSCTPYTNIRNVSKCKNMQTDFLSTSNNATRYPGQWSSLSQHAGIATSEMQGFNSTCIDVSQSQRSNNGYGGTRSHNPVASNHLYTAGHQRKMANIDRLDTNPGSWNANGQPSSEIHITGRFLAPNGQ